MKGMNFVLCLRSVFIIIFPFLRQSNGVAKNSNDSLIWKVAGYRKSNLMKFDKSETRITGGVLYELFRIIQQKLRFSYVIVKPIDEIIGDLAENGSWTGLIGKIANQEADISTIGLAISPIRYPYIKYSSVLTFQPTVFLIKAPKEIADWNSLMKPFSLEMWICVSLAVFIFGLILHKIMENDFTAESRIHWSRCKIYWNLFCSFMYQGLNLKAVKKFPTRFVIGIWWLSVVVLISSYSGTLMSYLTYPLTEEVPRNFEELANSVQRGEYQCGTKAGNIIWREILDSKSRNTKILRDHILSNNNLMSMAEAMGRVREERFAVIVPRYVIKYFIRKEDLHKYTISTDSLLTQILAFPMRKGFPFEKNISDIVTRTCEAGIVRRMFPSEDLQLSKSSEFRPLTSDDFASAYLLLMIGYSLSFSCLAVEIIYTKFIAAMNNSKFY
ncbi:glutamate receptor ionotropic, delta-1-like [Centruroides sculpturatus]|uniref:glutamate receptor ionotropic, delta-1-like n=1 Tax=Centruroides sculpturatus TaxID=218467 RepID=UPI000C6DE95B|nr:glutamate receptor ionotropic, delta-1-like [Centruroides sculpturatus]